MGSPVSCSAVLLLVAAVASASFQPQQQPLLPGYSKDVQPFADYNMPFVPRAPLWRRAAEIQSSDGMVGVQQPPYEHSRLLIDYPPPPPPKWQQQQQQQQPQEQLDSASFSTNTMADVRQPHIEHSMLLIDHPPPPPPPPSGQQLGSTSTNDMADVQQPPIEHSMLLIDYPPSPRPPPSGQQLVGDSTNNVPDVQHSMLQIDHPPPPAAAAMPQQQAQEPVEGTISNEPPPADRLERQLRLADQQTRTQEALVAPEQMAPSQVPQGDSPVYQGKGVAAPQVPGPYQYAHSLGQRPYPDVTILQRKEFFGTPVQPEGPVFQSSGPYPVLSPPPAYSPQGPSPWSVVHPGPIFPYPQLVREPQLEQGGGPVAGAHPVPSDVDWDMVRKADSVPLGLQQQMGGPLGTFNMRPYAVDHMRPVLYPAYDRMPMPPPVQYEGEGPVEIPGTSVTDLGEREQSQAAEEEKDNDQEPSQGKHEEESAEDRVKDLKDAVDVEEEVVPALVVFLRKKGHKALHDKDSVGIPGKEDRFRRSPGGGSGSSSHSSSSSSSSSGPVYFGDGAGSYSSSSSQSSASSGSGGGAPLGFGGSGPGLGGSGSFYGGAQVPPSGYGASGYGNSGPAGGYGNSGLGGGYGGLGGGSGVGSSGYGPGYGGSSGCATCGGDGNVLLNRFGAADDSSGPFSVGGSGVSTGKGVHASSSSSIDSTGKVTYSAFAGKH